MPVLCRCGSVRTADLRGMLEDVARDQPAQESIACKGQLDSGAAGACLTMLPASFARTFKAGGFLNRKAAENLTQCVMKMQSCRSHVDVMDFLDVRLPQLLKTGRDKLNGSTKTNVAALQTSEKEEQEEAALKRGLCVVATVHSPAPVAEVQHAGRGSASPGKFGTPASVRLPAIVQLRGILRNSPT